jgi:hypothetical protein
MRPGDGALDRRTPGASLHAMLRGRAVGTARVVYPDGVSFSNCPSLEVLGRIVEGLRQLDEGIVTR